MNVGVPLGSGAEKIRTSPGNPAAVRPPIKKVDEPTRHRALALTGRLVAPGADEGDVMAFVDCLADLFRDLDPKLSLVKYEETGWNLVQGAIPLHLVMESIEAACDKDPKKLTGTRGGYFMGVLKTKLGQWRRAKMGRTAESPPPAPTPLLDAVEGRGMSPEPSEALDAVAGPDPRFVVARLAGDLAAGTKVPRPSDSDAGDALPPDEASAQLRAIVRGGSGGSPALRSTPPPTRRPIDRAELEKLAATDPILARELASRPRPES